MQDLEEFKEKYKIIIEELPKLQINAIENHFNDIHNIIKSVRY